MINVTINAARGGSTSAPFAALATERIAFQGDVIPTDDTSVAILDAQGATLAHGFVVGGEVDLDLNTVQADAATRYAAPDEPIRAYIAVGDTDNLLAVITCQVVRNVLDNIAPPTQMAPTYPTSDALATFLFQCEEAVKNAKKWATDAQNQASTALTYVQQSATNANLASQAHQQAQASANNAKASEVNAKATETRITRAEERINGAVSNAERHKESAREAVVEATDLKDKVANTEKSVSGVKAQIDATKTAIDETAKVVEQSKNDAVKAKDEAEQAKTEAVTAKGQAETAKGQAEGFAKTASESASNASKSAKQAEDAKDAIGDVGSRLDAVETSVAEKVPYVSPVLSRNFNFKRGNFKMLSITVLPQLHEGFLMRDSYNTAKDRLLVPRLNEIRQVDSVGTVRLSVIEDDKTTIYSYKDSVNYKTTVTSLDGGDLSFVRETIDAMPTAIAELSNVIGYKTTNGYIVCTQGHILSADLTTEVATFYAVDDYTKIRKNGNGFWYYDGSVKKFATLTIGEDGTPSIAYNSYIQTDGKYYPITSTMYIKLGAHGRLIGATANGIGYLYGEIPKKEAVFGVTRLIGSVALIIFADTIYALYHAVSNASGEKMFEVARGLFDCATYNASHGFGIARQDYKGDFIVAYPCTYNNGDENQYYNLFVKK